MGGDQPPQGFQVSDQCTLNSAPQEIFPKTLRKSTAKQHQDYAIAVRQYPQQSTWHDVLIFCGLHLFKLCR